MVTEIATICTAGKHAYLRDTIRRALTRRRAESRFGLQRGARVNAGVGGAYICWRVKPPTRKFMRYFNNL